MIFRTLSRTRFLATAALALVLHSPAIYAEMYGNNAAGEFFIIDLNTGAGTARGTLPISGDGGCCTGYNEIAYDASSGTAWAQERNGNFRGQSFDLASSGATSAPVANGASWHAWEFIGSTLYAAGFAGVVGNGLATMDPTVGISSVNVITDGTWDGDLGPDVFTGLAYDGATLFGITNGAGTGNSFLFSIDLVTGALTLIGESTIRAGSLEFGDDNNLYAGGASSQAGNLYQIDPASGAATLIGDTGFGNNGGITGLMRAPFVPFSGPTIASASSITGIPVTSNWFIGLLVLLLFLTALHPLHARGRD